MTKYSKTLKEAKEIKKQLEREEPEHQAYISAICIKEEYEEMEMSQPKIEKIGEELGMSFFITNEYE